MSHVYQCASCHNASMETQSHRSAGPPPDAVTLFTVDDVGLLGHHVPLGVVIANGTSAYEAVAAFERNALQLARQAHTRLAESAQPHSGRRTYVVAGMRIAAGTSASGQPEWIAYGTLVGRDQEPAPH
jgi:hypothetical protein